MIPKHSKCINDYLIIISIKINDRFSSVHIISMAWKNCK